MPAQTPAEIHTLFRDAYNLGDVEALVALYEPNATLIVGGESVSGSEEIRKSIKNILKHKSRITLETQSVIESAQGIAVLHGSWVVERVTGPGAELTTRGLSTEVVRRQPNGTWLFLIDNPYTPGFQD